MEEALKHFAPGDWLRPEHMNTFGSIMDAVREKVGLKITSRHCWQDGDRVTEQTVEKILDEIGELYSCFDRAKPRWSFCQPKGWLTVTHLNEIVESLNHLRGSR